MQSDILSLANKVFFLLVGILLSTTIAYSAERSQTIISNDGTATIPWHSDYDKFSHFHILNEKDEVQSTYPVIAEQGWVISGLANGLYTIQLSNQNNKQIVSTLNVRHYSLHSAFTLFVLGALMFFYLVYTLVRQQGNTSRHD